MYSKVSNWWEICHFLPLIFNDCVISYELIQYENEKPEHVPYNNFTKFPSDLWFEYWTLC